MVEVPLAAVPDPAGSGAAKPRAPAGLSARARSFWRCTVADFEMSAGELEILTEAVGLLSELDGLRAAIRADGVTVVGSRGQSRVNPALNEARQHRMALARLLKQLDLPVPTDDPPKRSARSETASKAAQTRWAIERDSRAGRGA